MHSLCMLTPLLLRQLEQQNMILNILSRFSPHELQHMSVAPTPDGQGVHLRWHKHQQAPVPIPALELLAVTGHAMAASLPPAAASDMGDQDAEMGDEDGDEDEMDGDVKSENGDEDDRRSKTPTGGPATRYSTEPIAGSYDPSPLTRGRSVDVEAVNAAHAARMYPQLVAQGTSARERWAQAERAGVFTAMPPADNAQASGSGASQNAQGHTYGSPAIQEQQQQPQQRFPPLIGGSVVRRCTSMAPKSQGQRPRTSFTDWLLGRTLILNLLLANSKKGKGRDLGDGWGEPRYRDGSANA